MLLLFRKLKQNYKNHKQKERLRRDKLTRVYAMTKSRARIKKQQNSMKMTIYTTR